MFRNINFFLPTFGQCWIIVFFIVVVGSLLALPLALLTDNPLILYVIPFVPAFIYVAVKGKYARNESEAAEIPVENCRYGSFRHTFAVALMSGIATILLIFVLEPLSSLVEIPELRNTASLGREQIKAREGELLLKHVRPSDFVVLLDERGRKFRSVEFAAWLQDRMSHSAGADMVFVIGGAYGFSPEVYGRADAKMSLSDMTFSHQMVRTIFAEQLYRAFTIIRGEPYHHE